MAAKVQYTYATGRRKTSASRVFLKAGSGEDSTLTVNGRALDNYFPLQTLQKVVTRPLSVVERDGKYDLKITVRGGGMSGQAGAVAHGIARVLIKEDPELRPVLKKAGLLTRDPRKVERKKPGRHKARKKPQFSKR